MFRLVINGQRPVAVREKKQVTVAAQDASAHFSREIVSASLVRDISVLNARYTPPTRLNCRVWSRQRCVGDTDSLDESEQICRQRSRVLCCVGAVNAPVGSRRELVANSVISTHRRRRRDATRQLSRVGVGGVYWA